MVAFKSVPIDKVKVGLIGIGNRGKTLIQMFEWLIEKEKAKSCERFNIGTRNIILLYL